MMKPLYMWAGGKNKMIPKYKHAPGIPYSNYSTYVEPFFGGGAMMIHMHQNAPNIKNFVINDINQEIVGIYETIKYDVNEFIQRLNFLQSKYLPLSKEDRKIFYYDLRDQYTTNWSQWNKSVESATLYFLMKTGFNGIWQTNKKSNGRFATPAGLLNQTISCFDLTNILEWHEFLQKTSIHCGDWKSSCDKITDKAFFFMDPPYRDSFTQYGQIFNDQNHIDLINFCKEQALNKNHIFYCNRDTDDDFYEKNKGNLKLYKYSIKYTAGRRATNEDGSKSAKSATEILLYS